MDFRIVLLFSTIVFPKIYVMMFLILLVELTFVAEVAFYFKLNLQFNCNLITKYRQRPYSMYPTMQLLLMAINIADNIACTVHASWPLVPIDPLPNHKARQEANRRDSSIFAHFDRFPT